MKDRQAWEADPARGVDGLPYGALWVRLPRFIGDSVMIHQSLEPLRRAGIPLVAWGPPAVADLFRGSEAFAAVWADGPERGSAWALRRLLRASGAMGVLNLPRSTRALLASWLARVPLRVGWVESGGRLLATHRQAFKLPGHQVDRYKRLISEAFPELAPQSAPPFRPRPQAMEQARAALKGVGVETPYVALALGAMTATKRLGTEVWVPLIQRLRASGLAHVMLGAGREDEEQASAILERVPDVPNLAGQLPIAGTAGVIAQALALVGNDSSMSHLAAACATPAVVAFGPTVPSETAPLGPKVRVIRREDLKCLECRLFACPVPGHPCMDALSEEAVWEALVGFLLPR